MRCLRDSAWGSKDSIVVRLCAGQSAFTLSGIVLFRCQKRTRKPPAISTRWTHEKGAARPFQTPKEKSKWKNASRFAKRIFLTSPIYGFAEGVTSLLTVKFCESLKSSAKP